jgi:hypothetical protein
MTWTFVQVTPAASAESRALRAAQRVEVGLEEQPITHRLGEIDAQGARLGQDHVDVA